MTWHIEVANRMPYPASHRNGQAHVARRGDKRERTLQVYRLRVRSTEYGRDLAAVRNREYPLQS